MRRFMRRSSYGSIYKALTKLFWFWLLYESCFWKATVKTNETTDKKQSSMPDSKFCAAAVSRAPRHRRLASGGRQSPRVCKEKTAHQACSASAAFFFCLEAVHRNCLGCFSCCCSNVFYMFPVLPPFRNFWTCSFVNRVHPNKKK